MIYYVPTDPDYYGPVSQDEADNLAKIIAKKIEELFPDVAVKLAWETFSHSTRNDNSNPIISHINDIIQENYLEWTSNENI
jgi:hypothetical protein